MSTISNKRQGRTNDNVQLSGTNRNGLGDERADTCGGIGEVGGSNIEGMNREDLATKYNRVDISKGGYLEGIMNN